MKLLIQIGLYALAALVLAGAAAWVLRLGPFNPAPSAASKVQAQTDKAVAEVTKAETVEVGKVAEGARVETVDTARRVEHAAAQIRYVERTRPVPVPYPDDAFFRGMCQSKLYAANPDCRRYGGGPEGADPAARP